MAVNRDPLFIACFNGNHEGYKDEPDYPLSDEMGKLVLRTGETILAEFQANIMLLRYPEQRWLIQPDKIQNWHLYFTSERIVAIHDIFFQGAFEFFDFIEEYGKFAGLHPTEDIPISTFFHWLGQQDKKLRGFSLIFQLAYTRISMISCIKQMSSEVSGLEFWYEDGPNASQTQVQITPLDRDAKGIYDLGVLLQGSSLKEKELSLQKKHELDPTWEVENYHTYLAGIQRLVKAPDFLAMGSGDLSSESFDPISFQPHPIIWSQEVFSRSLNGSEPIRVVNLKY